MKISKYVWEGSGGAGGSEVREIKPQTSEESEIINFTIILQIIGAG